MIKEDWTFVKSNLTIGTFLRRIRNALLRKHEFPKYKIIKPVCWRRRWCVYFIYAPGNEIWESHIFTIKNLKATGSSLLVVYASPTCENIPQELVDYADALYWKELNGFDFSAYAIALNAIAKKSSGADVFLMNDSVYGPFDGIVEKLAMSKWKLTGVTASGCIENHIQTYAFHIKNLVNIDVKSIEPIITKRFSFNHFGAVVLNQETQLARIAAKKMSVGALYYAADEDLTLLSPLDSNLENISFLKRSLLEGKFRHMHPMVDKVDFLQEKMHFYPNRIVRK